jgi:ATP-dependent Lon protease
MRTLLQQFEQYINLSKKITPEVLAAVSDITQPGRLADVISSHLPLKMKDKQAILEMTNVHERLAKVLTFLGNEREVVELERKIRINVKRQMEKNQKEYYLREQMKAIQKELGDKEVRLSDAEELRAQLADTALPEEVAAKVEKEINRLERTPQNSPEIGIIRNYLELILSLPWYTATEDDLDIKKAEQILNEDHYGLEKAKERVLEYLAVRKLVQTMKGPILCLVGPPGVGKTSIARSIARSMNRKFVRLSLGGVRDEAEIRGHRRTYVGAMPGRIIQGMKTAGTVNPVFLLDEIDKMASDFRGDPAAALLEVLDPEQNNTFSDHFLEIPYDLSRVMFVTTANSVQTIPRPLLDRMEILQIPGYTELEKMEIATRYLLPKQLKEHGLDAAWVDFEADALRLIIREYTREAGVRSLEKQIASVCRKIAKEVVFAGDYVPGAAFDVARRIVVDEAQVKEWLGHSYFRYGVAEEQHQIGAATGLAWTEVGGDTLVIEVTILHGSGKLTLTGQLGDVMKESAQAAFSYTRSKAAELHIADDFYTKYDIHIHVPEGAIPKDGPSAGITMATALISALTGRYVRKEVAMTGEITLRGRVLPIGGLKEKALAAHRAGIRTIIIPFDNGRDLDEIPESVRGELTFIPVHSMDEVIAHALAPAAEISPYGEEERAATVAQEHLPLMADTARDLPDTSSLRQ